jgi:hypothetical protein
MGTAGGASDLGLGCGNPLSFAEVQPGDTVLDLGSGAGFDAFLAGKAVGSAGKVIGTLMCAAWLHTQLCFQHGYIHVYIHGYVFSMVTCMVMCSAWLYT